MNSASLTAPPTAPARLVVDTDVASYIFKWHTTFAPLYVELVRGSELVLSFMTLAEMRQGALEAKWGIRRRRLMEAYLADFVVFHSDDRVCHAWAETRSESRRQGRPMGSPDAWIAATALTLSAPLVTNNPKDYHHLSKLQIISAAAG